jgi:enoyl-CoA hydratase/carnithine racemase
MQKLDYLHLDIQGDIAEITLDRPAKRNALNDPLIETLHHYFLTMPDSVKAIIIHANGDNFSAGLDLSELTERNTIEGVMHSMSWHKAFECIEYAKAPVISVLKGAVVGGGLELACATHVRVAEPSTYYALPEGQRGIFVGGGAAVRVPRLIGTSRMADMMLTGRVIKAEEGERIGLSNYAVDEGKGLEKARELAAKIAKNSPVTNFAVIQALPRIAEANPGQAFMMESLMAAIAQGSDQAKAALQAFLNKQAKKVTEL